MTIGALAEGGHPEVYCLASDTTGNAAPNSAGRRHPAPSRLASTEFTALIEENSFPSSGTGSCLLG